MRVFGRFVNVFVIFALVGVFGTSARTRSQIPGGDACSALARRQIPETTITVAHVVREGSVTPPGTSRVITGLPDFCRVVGELRPTSDSQIGFELWLPMANWNRKLAGAGNVGFGGVIQYDYFGTGTSYSISTSAVRYGFTMADQLKRGYATVATDTGHRNGDGGDDRASFALAHRERVIDFAYRAVHEAIVKGKVLTTAFYGRPIEHTYWIGQSTGGRQGLMEAQRYPDDLDGIVVGAPPINLTWNWVRQMDAGLVVAKDADHPLISAAPLELLNHAAIAACDPGDGLLDGLIGDPRTCTFDPGTLLCRLDQTPGGCLTATQVEAARHIYDGLKDPVTGALLNPGLQRGSELSWGGAFPGGLPHPASISYFKWLVAEDAAWDWKSFDFRRPSDYEMVRKSESRLAPILSAMNPDLREFKSRGGKILQFHGWSDERVEPETSTNYYEDVARVVASGGRDRAATLREAQTFYRLFMVPDMNHGLGNGAGPNEFDVLTALEQWVERGIAPRSIVARHSTNGVTDRSRPLCPYPTVAKYSGNGDTKDAGRFVCGN
jgi:feruloyl esterase